MALATCSRALEGMQPAEQADAAQPRLAIDQRDLHAQVGGQKRRGITARSAA